MLIPGAFAGVEGHFHEELLRKRTRQHLPRESANIHRNGQSLVLLEGPTTSELAFPRKKRVKML